MTITNYPNGVSSYGMPVFGGLPVGKDSKVFFVDPAKGDDGNDGTSPLQAKATLLAAYNLTTDGNNDTVFFIPGGTADNPAATLTWSNSYTHLVGLGPPLPGMGMRCRVEGLAATDLTSLITVSGSGCIFSGIKWINLADADVDSGAMTVTGGRNAFIRCQISGMGHATPGARAGSYSLTMQGEECYFHQCTIGLDTIVRAAANAEMVVSGGALRNTFEKCSFSSASETAGKFLVSITDMDRWIKFIDCNFYNFSVNWANTLTDVFSVTEAATHNIYFLGNNFMEGFTGWGDTVTHMYSAAPAPNAGWGLGTNPTG